MNNFTKLLSVVALSLATHVANAQTPTTPPTLKWDAGEIGVIYAADQDTYFDVLKDSKGNSVSSWVPVTWGQQCVISDDACGDGAAIRIDNLDFLPMQFQATVDVSDYRFFHVEFWVSSDMQLDLTFQNWWPGEKFVTPIYELKAGEWNVIDIDMDQEAFTWSKKNEIAQHCINVLKLGGEAVNEEEHPYAKTVWMTNIVVHNDASVVGIANVKADGNNSSALYNLAGQRVSSNYKGVVVKGGKKFFNQ